MDGVSIQMTMVYVLCNNGVSLTFIHPDVLYLLNNVAGTRTFDSLYLYASLHFLVKRRA